MTASHAPHGDSDAAVRVEVCVRPWPKREDRYFVYWETESAYGSRGDGLTKDAAYALAARIEETGDPSVL